MYMQIRKYRLTSGSAEQLCRQAADELLPAVKNINGFVNYMTIDNQDGTVMSVSIFKDKAGIDECMNKAIEWHRQASDEQLEGPLEVIDGQVLSDSSGFFQGRKAA